MTSKRPPTLSVLNVLAALVAGWWLLAAPALGQTASAEDLLARARQIHRRAITLDTHVDIAGAQYATPQLDPGIDNPRLKCDLVKMAAGGVDGVFLAVFVAQGKRDAAGYKRAWDAAMVKFDAIGRLTQKMYPDRCQLATSPDQVKRIVESGKLAVMIGVENGYPLGTDLANLRKFYQLGARYITLCHNGHNQICDSCNPSSKLGDKQSEHGGLSEFGRKVVAEMNRLGMIIDVSHLAPQSFWDLIEASKAPLLASHSGCRAVCDHPRNLDDAQLKALAARGGVIQVVAVPSFLKPPSAQRRRAVAELAQALGIPTRQGRPDLKQATQAQRRQYREGIQQIDKRYPPASIQDYVDHIQHAIQVAGIDHVGIGSDFDGGGGVAGFNDHSEALNVTVELLRRGYSEAEIQKIWGGNLLRLWRDVERVAARLRQGSY